MTLQQAILILKHHNNWRRGNTDDPLHTPKEIGRAIDMVVAEQEKPPLEQTVQWIKQRIIDEHRKHKDLDWEEIAARKIYGSLY